MILTLAQASTATGKAKSTLLRAIKAGRLSASRNEHGEYLVDVSELSRVYVVQPISTDSDANDAPRTARTDASMQTELAAQAIEITLLRERIQDLKDNLVKVEADKARAEMLHDAALAENRQLLLMLTHEPATKPQAESGTTALLDKLFKRGKPTIYHR